MKLFEDSGLDAVILHPRFFEDKFKRRARHELLPWAASLTRLPLIANGDIDGPETVVATPDLFKPAAAIMIGRMAAARPWVFATWDRPLNLDLANIWHRFSDYTSEDFTPEMAIRRIKLYTEYYARNFQFGHSFYTAVQNAPTLDAVRERADAFFSTSPVLNAIPPLMGL